MFESSEGTTKQDIARGEWTHQQDTQTVRDHIQQVIENVKDSLRIKMNHQQGGQQPFGLNSATHKPLLHCNNNKNKKLR